MIKVLSIAGSDPSSGAGIQADLKTFQRLGAFGMAIPAALTAQNSRGVSAVHAVPSRFLAQQLETLLADMRPQAVKTGMLLSRANVEVVAAAVADFRIDNLILDPIVRSSSGSPLLQPSALHVMKRGLFPLARIVTPNLPEAEVLTGTVIRTEHDMDRVAERLLRMGPAYVLLKGGHRKGPAADVLYSPDGRASFSTKRRKGEFHGTGCLLSAALTVFIARGETVEKAVEKAKQYVDRMLTTASRLGGGRVRYFM